MKHYIDLEMANYLKNNEFDIDEMKLIFKFQTKMSKFGENFRGGETKILCPPCGLHHDTQESSFECSKVKQHVDVNVNFDNIFSDCVNGQFVDTLKKIMELMTRVHCGS